jgi:HNH endonuclease
MVLMLCPYCGYEKDVEKFTDEHVLPRALGGAVLPTNPFVCRVCNSCNAACGRWIDGRFARSSLIHNARSEAMRRTYDPASNPTFSLSYMGSLNDWKDEGNTQCDFWLGPTGDHIFHFHQAYDELGMFAGRPPHLREAQIDPGNVFVRLVGSNPEWHPIVIRSTRAAFEPATALYLVNAAPPGHRAPYPCPEGVAKHQYDWMMSRPEPNQVDCTVTLDMNVPTRFLIKCALGLGTCFLGDTFPPSDRARLLREALWQRDPERRDQLNLAGSSFFSGNGGLTEFIGWKSCHTFVLLERAGDFGLLVVLYGQYEAGIKIGSAEDPWVAAIAKTGQVWVIAPGFGRFAGPMTLPEYMSARIEPGVGVLSQLEDVLSRGAPLPPFHKAD